MLGPPNHAVQNRRCDRAGAAAARTGEAGAGGGAEGAGGVGGGAGGGGGGPAGGRARRWPPHVVRDPQSATRRTVRRTRLAVGDSPHGSTYATRSRRLA